MQLIDKYSIEKLLNDINFDDEIFVIMSDKRIYKYLFRGIRGQKNYYPQIVGYRIVSMRGEEVPITNVHNWGITVFPTYEEAEKHLKEIN